MDIGACKSFLAVFDTGSATAAANQRYVSQPALSRQIHALEKRCRAILFTRSKSGMQPTHAARQLEPVLRRLVTEVKTAQTAISTLGADTVPLTIACPILIAEGAVLPFAAETRTVMANVVEYPANTIYEALSRREVDLTLTPSLPPPEFESRLLYRISYSLQVPANSEMATRSSIDIRELPDLEVIVPDKSNATRLELDRRLSLAGVRFSPMQEVARAHIGQAMVKAGKGTVVTVDPPKYDLAVLTLCDDGVPLELDEWAAWPVDHFAQDSIAHFIDTLLAWIKKRPEFKDLNFVS